MLVELNRITTDDGLTLDGAAIHPKTRKRVGILYVHGLTSSFYHGQKLWGAIAHEGSRIGIGVASFNTRGHDILTSFRQEKRGRSRRLVIGSAQERFQECVLDIRAGIRFLKRSGYRHVILLGHSTGANKVLFTASKIRDRGVRGIILAGSLSDVAVRKHDLGKRFEKNIAAARRFSKRRGRSVFLPSAVSEDTWSASRYLSLFSPGSIEDVFPYHNPRASWSVLRTVRIPIFVLLGKNDEYLDRPASDIASIMLAKTSHPELFRADLIDGANHNFRGYEKLVAKKVTQWVKNRTARP